MYVGETIKKVLKDRIRLLGGTFFKNVGIATLFQLSIMGKRVLVREKIIVRKHFAIDFYPN